MIGQLLNIIATPIAVCLIVVPVTSFANHTDYWIDTVTKCLDETAFNEISTLAGSDGLNYVVTHQDSLSQKIIGHCRQELYSHGRPPQQVLQAVAYHAREAVVLFARTADSLGQYVKCVDSALEQFAVISNEKAEVVVNAAMGSCLNEHNRVAMLLKNDTTMGNFDQTFGREWLAKVLVIRDQQGNSTQPDIHNEIIPPQTDK